MRARNLKPGFFTNELLAKQPPLARLLFAGLWCLADREGRLENRPERIKAQLFPYQPVNVIRFLKELEKSGFLVLYGDCIAITGFKHHQKPHTHEPESKLPPPPKKTSSENSKSRDMSGHGTPDPTCHVGYGAPLPLPLLSDSPSPIPVPCSLNVDMPQPVAMDYSGEFEKLWAQYPERVGKRRALGHWNASVKTPGDVAAAGLALKNYLASRRVREGYIQNGSTWFCNWRDWIEPPEAVPTGMGDKDDPLAKVIRCYKILRGVDKNDQTWDAGHWADSVNPARRILEVFDGDWRAAVDYMQEQSAKFTAEKLSWKLETLEKYADEYRAGRHYAKAGN